MRDTHGKLMWVNGLRVKPEMPALSAYDRGLWLGDGVFETIRAARGVMIALDAHLDRLAEGLTRLRIPLPVHLDETLWDVARDLTNASVDHVVRITVTRGNGPGVVPSVTPQNPTCLVAVYPMAVTSASVYERGLDVAIASGRLCERAARAGLKSTSYVDTVLTLIEARERGVDDAIVLDDAGHVAEGATSNVFVVSNGGVRTPPASCGILRGITRAWVLQYVPVQEAVLVPSDLYSADEVFLTSSLRGIAPVRVLEGQPIGRGVLGPVTRRVMAAYARAIEEEVADHARGSPPTGR